MAAVLGIAVLVVWLTLTRAAVRDAQVGLDRGVRQLVAVISNSIRGGQTRYTRAAEDPAIRAALSQPDPRNVASAKATLARLGISPDSGLPLELWNASGARIASVGTDTEPSVDISLPAETPEPTSIRNRGLDSLRIVDSTQLGELQRIGTRSLFWLVMPVRADGKLLGFVASRRHIGTNPQTEATIRELGSNSPSGYYRNIDGTTWTSFGGLAESPSDSAVFGRGRPEHVRRAAGRLLFAEERIPGTPLVLGMEAPRTAILAGPNQTSRQLAVLGALLTLVAALVTWFVGRRVMQPLVELTNAADLLARGKYSTRVPTLGTEEVRRLASSFNRMAQQIGEDRKLLETANRAKSDFLASMSHELRTPLNAIGGYTELMEMGVRGPITEEQRRDLGRIRTSQSHLLGLIGSLLDLSRIESGQISYSMANVELDPLLGGLEALVLPQATAKHQTLVYTPCAPDLAVFADREKLRQILLNLLSNAVRHSPSGAAITMTARRNGKDTVMIDVRDTGPGIPLDRQRMIFEPFVQLDRSLTQVKEGVGLGLSISRDLALGMSGQLTVESAPAEGACFTLTLPARVEGARSEMAVSGSMEAIPARR